MVITGHASWRALDVTGGYVAGQRTHGEEDASQVAWITLPLQLLGHFDFYVLITKCCGFKQKP
jgi:hypothetical protein